jgi:Zn-dependent protease with chaperone function
MNFFDHQDRARKKTSHLVVLFLIAIILIILTIDGVVMLAFILGTQDNTSENIQKITPHDLVNLFLIISAIVSPVIISVILLGTLYKIFSLRNGGISVAKMVNAKAIEPDTQDLKQKRFINIVEEMSIASGVPIPKLFVMENELAINAFVAGIKPDDTVMVVTQGALDNLSRDELQGVVGHEYSHIFNSDMQISLRLIGILGGLIIISQAGYFLIRIIAYSPSQRRSKNDSDGRLTLGLFVLGIGLFIIGYIGLFFGRLIKSSIARQRELLADASSVAYTRNPQGLIYALKRIQESEVGTQLISKNSEDISHLCFCPAISVFFNDLFATHPPLVERIKILDPDGQFSTLPNNKNNLNINKESSEHKFTQDTLSVIATSSAIASIGNPTQENYALAKKLYNQIPEDLQNVAHNPKEVALLYYALVLPMNTEKNDNLTLDEITQVIHLQKQVTKLPRPVLLPLVDISLPTFRAIPIQNRQIITQLVQEFISLRKPLEHEDLFCIALISLLNKINNPKRINKAKYKKFEPVLPEISALLSLLIDCSQTPEQEKVEHFNKTMKHFTSTIQSQLPLTLKDIDYDKFQILLSTLNFLSPACKEMLITACLECIEKNKVIDVGEAELFRAIATCLDCPIPPIVATL